MGPPQPLAEPLFWKQELVNCDFSYAASHSLQHKESSWTPCEVQVYLVTVFLLILTEM